MLAETFRRNLRAAVHDSGLSVSALCRKAGYNADYTRKVLCGQKTNPTLQFVESMAGALGVSPQELLEENGDTNA